MLWFYSILSYANVINDWSQRRMNYIRRWLASNEIGLALESPTRIYLMRQFWYSLSFVIPIIGHFTWFFPICCNKMSPHCCCFTLVPNEFHSFFSSGIAFCWTNFLFRSFFSVFWWKSWKCEMSTETNLNRNRFGAANQTTKENLFIFSFTRLVLGSKRKEMKKKPEKYAKLDINREEKRIKINRIKWKHLFTRFDVWIPEVLITFLWKFLFYKSKTTNLFGSRWNLRTFDTFLLRIVFPSAEYHLTFEYSPHTHLHTPNKT